MQLLKKTSLFFFFVFLLLACAQYTESEKATYFYSGRVEKLQENKAILVGSASSVTFSFTDNICQVSLQSLNVYGHHNYVSLELDGEYLGRLRVDTDLKDYSIPVLKKSDKHTLKIYKATEAANGGILFNGAKTSFMKTPRMHKKKIEFIGNSITCGMGADTKEIPCGKGEWFDQHNAYLAYGPVISRKLDVDFQLSSVSGIGIYRNWNDEIGEEPIMPMVYKNLYLNTDDSKPYDFSFKADIISIALGTNDFSDGDGIKERLPFNPDKFVSNYIDFIEMLYKNNPKAQIVLVNSPMISDQKDKIFIECLTKIRDNFTDKSQKSIVIFEFKAIIPRGCTTHPDEEDHKLMANQYVPFLKRLLE